MKDIDPERLFKILLAEYGYGPINKDTVREVFILALNDGAIGLDTCLKALEYFEQKEEAK